MPIVLAIFLACLLGIAVAPRLVPGIGSRGSRSRRAKTVADAPPAALDATALRSTLAATQGSLRLSDKQRWRGVEVVERRQESDDTLSIFLAAIDGEPLPDYRPGQHIILERPASGHHKAAHRCYTLSTAPGAGLYRLTIKRSSSGGSASVSRWVHESLREGDCLRIRHPRGRFTLDRADDQKPVVFVAAGVGITPMAAMLQAELRFPRSRSKWLFYQVREAASAPLLKECLGLARRQDRLQVTIAFSRVMPTSDSPSTPGVTLVEGRLTAAAMAERIGTTDATIFLCGPAAWTAAMRDGFIEAGVPAAQVLDESFGGEPAAPCAPAKSCMDQNTAASAALEVTFEARGQRSQFQGGASTSLLEHARQHGVEIPASCRAGSCGTCAVKLLRGRVRYTRDVEADGLGAHEILPCVAVPETDIALDL